MNERTDRMIQPTITAINPNWHWKRIKKIREIPNNKCVIARSAAKRPSKVANINTRRPRLIRTYAKKARRIAIGWSTKIYRADPRRVRAESSASATGTFGEDATRRTFSMSRNIRMCTPFVIRANMSLISRGWLSHILKRWFAVDAYVTYRSIVVPFLRLYMELLFAVLQFVWVFLKRWVVDGSQIKVGIQRLHCLNHFLYFDSSAFVMCFQETVV